MRLASSQMLLPFVVLSFLAEVSNAFSVNDVSCDSIPFVIYTDVVFDAPLDLSKCTESSDFFGIKNTIFVVINDSTIDCDKHEFIGFDETSTAFQVLSSATFKNCDIKRHKFGIFRTKGISIENILVEDTTFTEIYETSIATRPNRFYDSGVNVVVKNCKMNECGGRGIEIGAPGTLDVIGSTIAGWSDGLGREGITVGSPSHTNLVTVRDSTIAGFDKGIEFQFLAETLIMDNVTIQNCPVGIDVTSNFEKISISNSEIYSMSADESYGIKMTTESSMIGAVELNDVSVCTSPENNSVDIWFLDRNPLASVTGALVCDDVIVYDSQEGKAMNRSEYCTTACPVSVYFLLCPV